MRFMLTGVVAGIVGVVGSTTLASAAERAAPGGEQTFFWVTVLTGGFAMALASAMAALAQARAISAALDGMARQPNAAGRIQTALIIGLAFIESLAIYVLLIALILLFANPFSAIVVKGG
ncbi:MAG TPA: ATP synthase F0 subunit C [Candidatus Methylomirabilis sp.]|jgi:F-type H+-transporting ATPase subunit c|nr:ATP synthase F0 subunit C [Candidatus Methylomirabilis sp.]